MNNQANQIKDQNGTTWLLDEVDENGVAWLALPSKRDGSMTARRYAAKIVDGVAISPAYVYTA